MTGYKSKRAAAQDNTYTYASSLATTIWQKHYIKDSPKWKPLETTDGVLTQIDNMTCGLVREKPAQPAQEPVAWLEPEWGEKICPEVGYEVTMTDDHPKDLGWIPLVAQPEQERNFCPRCGKRTADLTTIHTCTPPQENT